MHLFSKQQAKTNGLAQFISMNYLAHAYLSFGQTDILIGNMISDYVKGKRKFEYPPAVQTGIMLHRNIDTFTDAHPATKQAAALLKPVVGAYAGAFADVVYDHFLATDVQRFTDESLNAFAHRTYEALYAAYDLLPERFRGMLPYMKQQNWLYNYRTLSGIESSFGGVFRRAKYLEHTPAVYNVFEKQYEAFRECYNDFFPAVYAYTAAQLELLKKDS
ncbi:ACP phosphodiesterase [Panacibacter microcysteis]|nr:acyl carrier protein phosphodiesterase [Panacibacter microcysteis]